MTDHFLRVLRHETLEFALRTFVLQKGSARVAVKCSELGPGIRGAHVNDADGLNARPWHLHIDDVRCLAKLHAAPELLLRLNQYAEIERVYWHGDLDPLAATGDE